MKRQATEAGASGLPQMILSGTEHSARQAAAAREQKGRGMLRAEVDQEPPGGLFAEPIKQGELF